MRGDRLRARRVADAEAHADRQRDVPADLGELARDVGGVEMAGAGHALQRDVVDVAARERRDRGDARLGRRRREQEDRRDAARFEQRGELARFLGRIVDDEHAVDAGRRARDRRTLRTPIASIGLA